MNKNAPEPASSRLLAILAEPGAYALPDPTDDASLLVRRGSGSVSLGAGRFPLASGEDLVRRDLAAWDGARPHARRLCLTAVGHAHLRRSLADPADAFLEQHRHSESRTIATPDGPLRVRVDPEESPLDWLRRRRGRDGTPLIEDASYDAGERLRRDIAAAGLLPSVTAKWDGVRVDGGSRGPAEATDRVVAARQRLRHAFAAVGPDFSDLLIDLCGFLKGLEVLERDRGWPPRSGKVVVRLALARLAQHYGLANSATGPAARRSIRVWQALEVTEGAT